MSPDAASPIKVLVVDDHRDTRVLTNRLLATAGCEVRTADGCAAALATARGWAPDVLLCDLWLPDGDGCDLLGQVRAVAPAARALAVTGAGQPTDRLRCRQAGFDLFLLKPVAGDDLIAAVADLAAGTRAHRAVG